MHELKRKNAPHPLYDGERFVCSEDITHVQKYPSKIVSFDKYRSDPFSHSASI